MSIRTTCAASLLVLLGATSVAHAASYSCAYQIGSGEQAGTSDAYVIEAESGVDATNQALSRLNAEYGPVAFSLQCTAL
ncbi:hypothetical protein ACK1O1_14340 [Stenotrophomonas maltophilia]|jgi:hypothetical protein|uniref:hypothetical protein n=1 Tax=Stenotrophomonas TaxID=40323 RepID=UPI00201D0A2D|nr:MULTISPECIES: hypothetical protein [Stenotrophomonas]MBN5026792.1 hypothetical protein [Stenotrophomonas maltophilia]MDH1274771.1 hypothetical protein [Stenotrophomonas sp. GD03937]MDH1486864.1 hypothetical protein [Stenotrophomonas sp. GD03712]MDR2958595.1 hypothetical protein [Stenotrophomonas sp.]UQY95679.1 hypothetical protein LZ605_21600 [Stenotrophomonas maltophilia]